MVTRSYAPISHARTILAIHGNDAAASPESDRFHSAGTTPYGKRPRESGGDDRQQPANSSSIPMANRLSA